MEDHNNMSWEDKLYLASLLHDIGKIASFHDHTERSIRILRNILHQDTLDIIRFHEKRIKKKIKYKKPRKLRIKLSDIEEELEIKKDLLFPILSIQAGDKSASGLETTGLFKVGLLREYNSMIFPFLPMKLDIKIPLSWENIRMALERYEGRDIDLIKDLLKMVIMGQDIENFVLMMSLTPKDTRPPYNDVSVLTHDFLTAILSNFFFKLIKRYENDNLPNIYLFKLSIDFSKYLRFISRTSEHAVKVAIISHFYDHFFSSLIDNDNFPLLYRLFIVPVIPKIKALSIWSRPRIWFDELLYSRIKSFLMQDLIFIQFEDEKYAEDFTNRIIETLTKEELIDIADISLDAEKLLGIEELDKLIQRDGETLIIDVSLFNQAIRKALISLLREKGTKLFLGPATNKFSGWSSIGRGKRICEFCGIRPATYEPPQSSYRLCERCHNQRRKINVRGILLDDVSDEFGYIGLLRLIVDDKSLVLGSVVNEIPIHFLNLLNDVYIPAVWSLDRGIESSINVLLNHLFFINELHRRLESLLNRGILEHVYHVKTRVVIEKELKSKTFVDVIINDQSYPAILSPSKNNEYYLEIIGIHEKDLGELIDSISPNKIITIQFKAHGEETAKIIHSIEKFEISSRRRLYVPELSSFRITVLMPAILLPYAIDTICEFYQLVPLRTVVSKVFGKKEPLYLALKDI